MHRRSPNQQHQAKYSRMEPVDAQQTNDDSSSTQQASTKSAVRSPLLEPAAPSHVERNRNWSTHSDASLGDDIASIEATFADADWTGGGNGDEDTRRINEQQRLGGFPTSLPSLLTSSNVGESRLKPTSVSARSSPAAQPCHFRVCIDVEEGEIRGRKKLDSSDVEEDESMAASVYDNCCTGQNSDVTGPGASTENKRRPTPPQLQLQGTPNTKRAHHSTVTFSDQATSADNVNLSVPIYVGNRRKSGATGSAPNLLPGDQNNSTRRRSRSPAPRSSVTDASNSVAQGDGNNSPTSSPDEGDKKEPKVHSGPSSRRTVLVIAGLFVVGLILILAGIIVLTVEHHVAFRVAGCSFLGLGISFFIICLVLQRKNVKKLVNELEKDLYFLNVTDNKIWNMIFHFDEQMHWS